MMFGIVLHGNGWRIEYLGANTPVSELARVAAASRPELVVLAATVPQSFEPFREPIERFEAALSQTPERVALREIGETFVLPL